MTDREPGVPPAARILGYAGLLPNLAAIGYMLTLMGRTGTEPLLFATGMSAQVYAALILSFLGGTWWGIAAVRVSPERLWGLLVMAVIPSLFAAAAFAAAWIAPPPRGIALVLAVGFALSLAGDVRLVRDGLAPRWWMRLRVPLSLGLAAETLAAGLLA